MITSAILGIIYIGLAVVTAPLRLLPDATLPNWLGTSLTAAGNSFHILNQVFPVSVLLTALALLVSVEGSIFTYKILKWTYQKIPGVN